MSAKIQVYSPMQTWFHNHMLHLVIYLTITGLPILSDSFSWIAYLVGVPVSWFTGAATSGEIVAAGIQLLRLVHWISAALLTLMAIPFCFSMLCCIKSWNIWPDRWGVGAINDGIKEMYKCYIKLEHAEFGKFNIGQKASAWVMILSLLILAASGYVLMFRGAFSPEAAAMARMLHALFFVILGVTLIMHVYFATHPINRAAYKAMFKTGEMDLDYVKQHHPLWLKKMKK